MWWMCDWQKDKTRKNWAAAEENGMNGKEMNVRKIYASLYKTWIVSSTVIKEVLGMKIMAWYVSSRKSFGIDRNYVVLRVLDDHVGRYLGEFCFLEVNFQKLTFFGLEMATCYSLGIPKQYALNRV